MASSIASTHSRLSELLAAEADAIEYSHNSSIPNIHSATSHGLDKRVHDYDYIEGDSVSPHLVCPICTRPAIDPKVNSCGHMFCTSCLDTWNGTCPICRSEIHEASCCNASIPIISLLDDLLVRCIDCNSIMKRSAFSRHIHQCSTRLSSTNKYYEELSSKQLRNSRKDDDSSNNERHEMECLAHEYGCEFVGDQDALEIHLLSCPFYRVLPVLRQQTQQIDEQNHLNKQLQITLERYRAYMLNLCHAVQQYNKQIDRFNDSLPREPPIGPGGPVLSGPYARISTYDSMHIPRLSLPTPPTSNADVLRIDRSSSSNRCAVM